jgi:hypothetical protein
MGTTMARRSFAALPRPTRLARGTRTVLVVDDEECMLRSCSRLRRKPGYDELATAGGASG